MKITLLNLRDFKFCIVESLGKIKFIINKDVVNKLLTTLLNSRECLKCSICSRELNLSNVGLVKVENSYLVVICNECCMREIQKITQIISKLCIS